MVDPEEYAGLSGAPKGKRFKKELLSLAGVWSDLDAVEMIEELYKARHIVWLQRARCQRV